MPEMSGWEFLRQVRTRAIPTKIVLCTVCLDPQLVPFIAYEGGAGYLTKPVAPNELKTAIASVTQGGFPLSHGVIRKLAATDLAKTPPVFLSAFVRRVLFQPDLGVEAEAVRYLVACAAAFRIETMASIGCMEVADLGRQFRAVVGLPLPAWLQQQKTPGRRVHAAVLGPLFLLTECECTVATFLHKGFSRKEVAGLLGIRPTTVNTHVATILAKTQTDSVTAALYDLFGSSS